MLFAAAANRELWSGLTSTLEGLTVKYLEFLSRVHELLQPRSYLEIGVRNGHSIALSKTKSIGVDPAYNIAPEIELGPDVTLRQATSDDFFAEPEPLAPFDEPTIDLAFIDGLHLYEYVLRDFMNTEKYAAPGSVIIFDDILPRKTVEAARDRETRAWTGDVWKIIPTLTRLRPDLVCLQVGTQPTGLLVVLGADPTSTVLNANYDDLLKQYVDSEEDPPAEILQRTAAVPPQKILAAPFWSLLRDQRARGVTREQGLPELMDTLRTWAASELTATQAAAANAQLAHKKGNPIDLVRRRIAKLRS
jgi:predicted O-methyltransferase YrrM